MFTEECTSGDIIGELGCLVKCENEYTAVCDTSLQVSALSHLGPKSNTAPGAVTSCNQLLGKVKHRPTDTHTEACIHIGIRICTHAETCRHKPTHICIIQIHRTHVNIHT